MSWTTGTNQRACSSADPPDPGTQLWTPFETPGLSLTRLSTRLIRCLSLQLLSDDITMTSSGEAHDRSMSSECEYSNT